MSLRVSLLLLKKKKLPFGMSSSQFQKKLRNPGASKQWRRHRVESAGTMDVDPINSLMPEGLGVSNAMPLSPPRSAPMMPWDAPPDDDLSLHRGGAARIDNAVLEGGSSCENPNDLQERQFGSDVPPPVLCPDYSNQTEVAPLSHPPEDTALSTAVTLPVGKQLNLNVTSVNTYSDDERKEIPLSLQSFKRTNKERAESIVLPKHLNKLFHRLMKWTNEAVEIDKEHPLADDQMQSGPSSGSGGGDALTPQKKYDQVKAKLQYGVLLDAFEKDKFAVEHNLAIAGDKFEKQFLKWEGVQLLDTNQSELMAETRANKAAMVIASPLGFHVPIINRDPCPGCGALLQDSKEDHFGYVKPGQLEDYITTEEDMIQLRKEYADRMAELQAHWEKNGRRVGEEWLDFMTQEEFRAIYKHQTKPFVCHRCHALENLGVQGRKKVMSAPDFTENLRALKEKKCVVVLVIDVTDFPGSMVYDLPGLISMNNKVIIAANKCDCIRERGFNYKAKNRFIAARLTPADHIVSWVKNMAIQFGLPKHQILDVIPISARNNWNIDTLVERIEEASNLNLSRPQKPLETYFVGVANVGKSSVINAISHQLFVPQPPHPSSKKVYYTLKDDKGMERVMWRWYTPPNVNRAEMNEVKATRKKENSKLLTVSSLPGTTVACNAVKISLHGGNSDKEETFLYDTPGLFPHWHQSSPLTLYQMRRCLIRKFRNPECYIIQPGHTLCFGGVAALDVVKGKQSGLLMMVYSSQKTTHGVCETEKADEYWAEQLGKKLQPPGSLEDVGDLRLSVSKSYFFECFGRHRLHPKADIYICGVGWVAFCVGDASDVVIRVRTLPGIVHGVRDPLRKNDLRAWRRWPKLSSRYRTSGIPKQLDTVIRLTAKELEPGEEPMKLIERAKHPRHTVGSVTPFDDIVTELKSHGKL